MAERIRVREIDDDEGNRLLRIVRRGSGSMVTWRRAKMVLWSAQGMTVQKIAELAFTSKGRANGTWQRIFTQLQARADAKDLITWDINVDSTVCRAFRLQGSARGGMWHQPPQEAPRRGHEVRQACGPLRGDRPRRGHQ
ncbi:hypothetical protein [Nonomuraea wenchangensis]|uniref:hypothetical protein n=1 Tax=Nonomuraea wenchangensis TaxID=568860 RepID=UPI003F4E22A9